MTAPSVRGVKSADRTIAVIEYLADVRRATFKSILETFDLPRSSAHALLGTLVSSGWVRHDAGTRLYSLGIRAWEIGNRYDGETKLSDRAMPYLRALSSKTGETVQLATLDGLDNVYLAIAEADRPMRLASAVGARLPAGATGLGKVLLAQLPDAELFDRFSAVTTFERFTDHTITDPSVLADEVRKARAAGFATDHEEYLSGCVCVAVPVTSVAMGGAPLAMSITMPVSRVSELWPEDVREPLAATAQRLGTALSSQP